MKKPFLLLFFLFMVLAAHAQHRLKGRVEDGLTEQPLEFVSVYLNTTTRGTTTNAAGEFNLSIPAGKYEVVVSFIGYESLVYQIDTEALPPSIVFRLKPKENVLGMVEVKAQRDKLWYDNLEVFKEHFLGSSTFGRGCKLLNPEILRITFDHQTGLLSVSAEEPLKIENAALGYHIQYQLNDFKLYSRQGYVSFVGYTRYELMEGGKSKQRRWNKNRTIAYNGSFMHFMRALLKQQLEQEGFNVRRLYRTPNPERPSEEVLASARAYLRSLGTAARIGSNDSISNILAKASLPKLIEQLDINPVPYSEFLSFEEDKARMDFRNFLQVVYIGEKEEAAYVAQMRRKGSITPSFQTSVISIREEAGPVYIEAAGNLIDPLAMLLEGYWGWEKFGDMLPLDYNL